MPDPIWFNQTYYLQEKADSLNASGDGSVVWTAESVLQAMESAGLTPYEHYQNYGADEGMNPNQYFDQNYYLNAKVAELNAAQAGGRTDWTAGEVLQAIESAGLTPYEHFARYGVDEGLNPSASFDVKAYLQAKADANNAADGAVTWTPSSVLAIMESAGLDPLAHYINYGIADGLPATPVDSGGDSGGGDSGGGDSGGGDSGGGGSSGGGGDTTFTVTDTVTDAGTGAHSISFGGTATGDITVSISDAGVATFSRGGHTATTTVGDLAHATIALDGQTLVIDATAADAGDLGITITGTTGTVDATLTVAQFAAGVDTEVVHTDFTGTFGYSITDTVTHLTGDVGNFSGATHVTVKLDATHFGLSSGGLDSQVDRIDLNGQTTVVLTDALAHLTIIDSTGATVGDADITAYIQANDTDLTTAGNLLDTSIVDHIDLNNHTGIVMNVAEATHVIPTSPGSYVVGDSVAHLAGADSGFDAGDLSGATAVTVLLDFSHADIHSLYLDNDVTAIDLAGQTATLSVAEAGKTITNTPTGGSYTVLSGNGVDTITLADSIPGTVQFTNAAQFGDSITFGTGATDKIDISASSTLVSTMNIDGTTVLGYNCLNYITVAMSGDGVDAGNKSDVMTFLRDFGSGHAVLISANMSGESACILVVDGDSSALYEYTDSGEGSLITADELTLIATIGSVVNPSAIVYTA